MNPFYKPNLDEKKFKKSRELGRSKAGSRVMNYTESTNMSSKVFNYNERTGKIDKS